MSEWAKGEGDSEERTAYEYRELFLDWEIEFSEFSCPFCEIPLTPVNLYKNGEIAKSPHFRTGNIPHRFDCDGSPILGNKTEKKTKRRHVEHRELHLPEALVQRKNPVIRQPKSGQPEKRLPPSGEEVKRRRKKAGSLGPAIYRTCLVRSVSVAFMGVFRESYEWQREQKWTEADRKAWAATVLKESMLTLYDGRTLSYQSAFRNLRFPPPWSPRIYNGNGTVHRSSENGEDVNFVLRPDMAIESKQENGETSYYKAEIIIVIDPAETPTSSQRHTFRMLETAATENGMARWFAYGVMRLDGDDTYRMIVRDIDHIYIHALTKPAS